MSRSRSLIPRGMLDGRAYTSGKSNFRRVNESRKIGKIYRRTVA